MVWFSIQNKMPQCSCTSRILSPNWCHFVTSRGNITSCQTSHYRPGFCIMPFKSHKKKIKSVELPEKNHTFSPGDLDLWHMTLYALATCMASWSFHEHARLVWIFRDSFWPISVQNYRLWVKNNFVRSWQCATQIENYGGLGCPPVFWFHLLTSLSSFYFVFGFFLLPSILAFFFVSSFNFVFAFFLHLYSFIFVHKAKHEIKKEIHTAKDEIKKKKVEVKKEGKMQGKSQNKSPKKQANTQRAVVMATLENPNVLNSISNEEFLGNCVPLRPPFLILY